MSSLPTPLGEVQTKEILQHYLCTPTKEKHQIVKRFNE